MISMEETFNRGRGSYIKVKLNTVTIGRIEFSRDGMFRYFEPKTNELNPTFIENELDKLKERIKAHRKNAK